MKITTIKPQGMPMRILTSTCEGIHPRPCTYFSRSYNGEYTKLLPLEWQFDSVTRDQTHVFSVTDNTGIS